MKNVNIPIEIDGKEYAIQADSSSWIIAEKMIRKNKETKEEEIYYNGRWFYGKIETLLNNLLERKLRKSDAQTLAELQSNLKAIRNELKQAWDTGII